METLKTVNWIIGIIFFVCYTYQFLYIPVVWFRRARPHGRPADNDFAVLICARNEQAVIGDLIASLRGQTYDASRIHIFVLADNCTDDTALIARAAGATVYERFNKVQIGKGYALCALMEHLQEDYPDGFDGYFVFDADNILSPDYVEQMNRTFSDGHDIVTGYRNSKNYGDNWLSAGSGLWYLRESRYLNHARHLLGTSCAVGGTGFLFSRAVAAEMGPWPFHSLIEDIEFSIHQIVAGRRIAFCLEAVLYDEQPSDLRQSWRQRSRWCKGALQVFWRYGSALVRGVCRGSFACFDMAMATMPAFILSATALFCNVILAIYGAVVGDDLMIAVISIGQMLGQMYATMFAVGLITTVTEWRQIRTAPAKKVLYAFTFPLFMFTYIPIAVSVLFCRIEWKPVEHRVSAAALRKRGSQEALPF
ncbi:MAG: glycosyltransferase [Ruminococcaceae bacterium]|jgi:cellulose synthase/poly-beta-1,6-N-acetylglucosamine synthase-like glycosyltransferase|nr:glycosyltransferase [Oscillospiraceae bacterium]